MHPRLLSSLALVAGLLPIAAHAAEWRVTATGYGPVQAGMSVKQAEKHLGTRLRTHESRPLDVDCDFLQPESGHPGVSFMVEDGLVSHVQIDAPGIATDKGIRVGDTAESVRQRYGRALDIQPHKYEDGAFYYYAWKSNGQLGIKYVVTGAAGKVSEIHGGGPTILRAEGCS